MVSQPGQAVLRRDNTARGLFLILVFTVVAVLAIAWQRGLYAELASGFALRLGGVAAAAVVLATGLQWFGGGRGAATIVAAVSTLTFAYFAGIGAVLGLVLLVCTALAVVPPRIATQLPLSLVLLLGVAMLVAVVGWLLPFPIHRRWLYLTLALGLCVWRRQPLVAQLRQVAQRWMALEQRAPWWLLAVAVAVAVAGMGLWLPSLNYDDNAAHLLLPSQLRSEGYYHLDASSQAWALAPWANNVLGAIAGLFVGGDARATVDALWLLLGVHGAWRLAKTLGASDVVALSAAAMYASQPLVAYFTTTMQVDGASTAVLLQFAALLAPSGTRLPSALGVAVFLGLLAGLKVSNVVFVLPALAWLGGCALQQRQWRWLLQVLLLTALLAGASYAYAMLVTGNPLFPLFNGWFKSPFSPAQDLLDRRWVQQGVHWNSLWLLTFETPRFGELYRGAFGLALLALLPALLVEAARQPRSRAIAVWFLVSGLLMFWQIQYARYLFPAVGPLLVVAVVGAGRGLPAWGHTMLMGLLIPANLLLMPTTSWVLKDDPWQPLLSQGRAGAVLLEQAKVPERQLLRTIFEQTPTACVLMTDPAAPFAAMAGGRALVGKENYDSRTAAMVEWAKADASGQRWQTALTAAGVSHVMLADAGQTPLRQALQARGWVKVNGVGKTEVWAQPSPQQRLCTGNVMRARDQARLKFAAGAGQ